MVQKNDSEDMLKGAVYLRSIIWREIAELAQINGIKEAEQLRACILDGLRVGQQKIRAAKGGHLGTTESLDELPTTKFE